MEHTAAFATPPFVPRAATRNYEVELDFQRAAQVRANQHNDADDQLALGGTLAAIVNTNCQR